MREDAASVLSCHTLLVLYDGTNATAQTDMGAAEANAETTKVVSCHQDQIIDFRQPKISDTSEAAVKDQANPTSRPAGRRYYRVEITKFLHICPSLTVPPPLLPRNEGKRALRREDGSKWEPTVSIQLAGRSARNFHAQSEAPARSPVQVLTFEMDRRDLLAPSLSRCHLATSWR